MGKEKLKQDGISKMEKCKGQFTLVPGGDSLGNIIEVNMYYSQYNSDRTSIIVRRRNIGFKSVIRTCRTTQQLMHYRRVGYKTVWCSRIVHKTIWHLGWSCRKLKSKIIDEEGMYLVERS